jgi:Ran GTPase-activating protein (RanGAP) involved in mRNA processing and transport
LSCADSGAPFEQTNEVLFFDALSGIDADILAMPAFGEELAICRCCGATKVEHHAKGAMTHLDMSDNNFYPGEAGKALGDMLAVNTVLKQLDLSNCNMQTESTKAFAAGIRDNGSLSSLSLSKNALLTKEAGKVIGDMLKGNSTLKELDLSSNFDYGAGAADGPGFAQELADGIKDNGAMTKLNVSSNALCAEGGKFLAAALKGNHVMKELDISSNYLAIDANDKPDMSGVIAFANAISDMRAMTSLNLASNDLWAEGAKIVMEAIKVTKCTSAIILAPFSCPSDFSINCCCLLLIIHRIWGR